MLEQPNAVPEKDGHQVYDYLIKESRPDALLHDARGHHGDVLLARDRFRLPHRAFDPVRDELERRSCVDQFLRDRVGKPNGGLPPHPPEMSNALRPVTHAPIVSSTSRRSSALCGDTLNTNSVPGNPYSVWPPEYHAKSRSPPSPNGE